MVQSCAPQSLRQKGFCLKGILALQNLSKNPHILGSPLFFFVG